MRFDGAEDEAVGMWEEGHSQQKALPVHRS